MSGWIYIVELAPTGHVKVGRTAKLGARLAAHIANASFGGAAVSRTFSVACDDYEAAEKALIAALSRQRGAVLAHGKETFVGVAFTEAIAKADEVVARRNVAPLVQPETTYRRLLGDCQAIMDAHAYRRAGLAVLRDLLADAHPHDYEGMTVVDVGRALRKIGIVPTTVHCPVSLRTMRGIKREWLPPVAAERPRRG